MFMNRMGPRGMGHRGMGPGMGPGRMGPGMGPRFRPPRYMRPMGCGCSLPVILIILAVLAITGCRF